MTRPSRTIPAARARRRRIRRRRRLVGAALLLAPAIWLVATDVLRRPAHIGSYDRDHLLAYVATAAASTVLWAVLLYQAAARAGVFRQLGTGLFVTGYLLAVGVQWAFFDLYGIYYSRDCTIYAFSLPWTLVGHLPLGRPAVALKLAVTALGAIALASAARHSVRPRRRWRRGALVLVPLCLYGVTRIPASFRMWQSTTPDLIYVHALRAYVLERLRLEEAAPELRVQRRLPEPVPRLHPRPARPRNVLFVLQDSFRHDVSCNDNDPEAECATPFSSRAVPDRYGLDQLRSNASTTAISISNLWSALPPSESLETLLRVPLLWDYAAAAGYDGAYWTSQNVMFGSMRLYVQDLPVSHFATATEIDPKADYDAGARDALLTDRVIRDWDGLREPFFAVAHYSNGHYPYIYDREHAPFQPSAFDKSAAKNQHFFNYYRNVVYLSDMAVGRLLEHVRRSESGTRTVIVYTSDHGESFREHWQLGHTSSLYDEEIKVPGWVDAPPGTLSEDEARALRGARRQFVWHFDLAATMLDLMGIWDAPEMVPFRRRMIGHPITRPERTMGPVPLSNCSWLWQCGFRNWGMMQGHIKIEAREWDDHFHCFDLLADPAEQHDLGEAACAPLPMLARAAFGPMPAADWPSRKALLYGPPAPSASAAP